MFTRGLLSVTNLHPIQNSAKIQLFSLIMFNVRIFSIATSTTKLTFKIKQKITQLLALCETTFSELSKATELRAASKCLCGLMI